MDAAHCARSEGLCSTPAALLCGGNDRRCVRKPLVGVTRRYANKHHFTTGGCLSQIPPALMLHLCHSLLPGFMRSATLILVMCDPPPPIVPQLCTCLNVGFHTHTDAVQSRGNHSYTLFYLFTFTSRHDERQNGRKMKVKGHKAEPAIGGPTNGVFCP